MRRSVLGEVGRAGMLLAFAGVLRTAPSARATVEEFLDELSKQRHRPALDVFQLETLAAMLASGQIEMPPRERLAEQCAKLAEAMG